MTTMSSSITWGAIYRGTIFIASQTMSKMVERIMLSLRYLTHMCAS